MSRTSPVWAIRSAAASRRKSPIHPRSLQAPSAKAPASPPADQPKPRTSMRFKTQRPVFADPGLEKLLEEKGVVIEAVDESGSSWFTLLVGFGPTLLLIAAFVWISRRAAAAGGGLFGLGRSRAKRYSEEQPKVTFDDVAGIDEAENELIEIVDFLKNPDQVPAARRHRAERRAAGRCARNRQDAAGAGGCRTGGRPLLQPQRLRVHRDDRRRRRVARARPVQAGSGGRAFDHLHRRAGRHRPHARQRRAARRPRRARADIEPDPDRDGRLRLPGRRHCPGRDQPRRRARPGPAATGPLRPSRRGAASRPRRPRRDSQGAHQERPPGAGCLSRAHRRRDARSGRRRAAQPGQRGSSAGGAQGRERRPRRGLRGGDGEDHPRAGPQHSAEPGRSGAHRLPRGGPRAARHCWCPAATRFTVSRSCRAAWRWE